LGHNGGCSGAGAAAQAGCHEDHVAAAQHFVQLFSGFLRRFAPHFGVAAGAQTAGGLVAHTHPGARLGQHQCLRIGIHRHELDAGQTFVNHTIDGIAAAAAHTNNFDSGKRLNRGLVGEIHVFLLSLPNHRIWENDITVTYV